MEPLLEMGFNFFSKQNASNQHKDDEIVDMRAHLRTLWNALSSREKRDFIVAAKREGKNEGISIDSNIRPPPELTSPSNKSSMHPSTVNVVTNDFAPTLQEYPVNYETILIDFE